MRKAVAVVFCLLFFIPVFIFAEYNPPNGGEDLYELRSPGFLSAGASVVSQESPVSDAVNPAASALQQRTTLDFSYIGLVDPSDDGWQGHVANFGGTLPTRYGVFSSSLMLLTTSLDDMDLGTLASLKASFAKDLFPGLLVGTGLNLTLGTKDSFDYGASMDIGFIHIPERSIGLDDFRWGVSFLNAGKWYAPVDGRSSFPSPFTPVIGAGFTALSSEDRETTLGLTGDLSLPAFQDLRFSLGADFSYKSRFGLQTALRLDMRQLFDDDLAMRSLIPSFGISAVFKTDFKENKSIIGEKGWNRSDVKTRLSVAPLHDGIWAVGTGLNINLGVVDKNPPKLEMQFETAQAISPNLDGKNDAIDVPFSISDERYVMEYRFVVTDSAGKVVRTIENKEKRPENENFRSIVDRLLSVKSGIEIPSSIRWDGISDSGALVPDGPYSFTLEAKDDNGNVVRSEPRTFVIDTTPPKIEIAVPRGSELVFSPNDDGNKDTLTIEQKGSPEDEWKGEILDAAGSAVRSFAWMNSTPPAFTWDGKNDEGTLLPDGIYSYRITSTDKAGNKTVAGFDNIFINTEPTPIALLIDTSYFSPNGDGVRDSVTITPRIPVTFGLESWELTIQDETGRVMRRFSGLLNAPLPVLFDGRMESGTVLPEGSYTSYLQVLYRNGNKPNAVSPSFSVDLTSPLAKIRTDLTVFSPNGDGSKDEITFFQDTSREENWTGYVLNSDKKVVKTFTWVEKADSKISWTGTSDAGNLVPDGLYTYSLESVDKAGNKGVSNIAEFSINTEQTPVILSVDLRAFSPNGDGTKDIIKLTPNVKINQGIESFVLSIRDSAGRDVRVINGRGSLDPYYLWDGLENGGKRAPDGLYSAELAMVYQNGNRSSSKAGPFELDTKAPEINVTANYLLFSPDGDGLKDEISFTQKSSRESLWQGIIENQSGTPLRSYFWKEEAGNFTWDGLDDSGNPVSDGKYSYVVKSEDAAGNSRQAAVREIRLDTRKVSAFVTVDLPGFSPNGDGIRDAVEATVYVNLIEGLDSWALAFKDESGISRKVFTGTSLQSPMKVKWNGRSDDGKIVEGTYTAEFSAVYAKGNRPTGKSSSFLLDISPPVLTVGLSPLPFSPDNDGIADELYVKLGVRDASPILSWSFDILDRNSNLFKRFTGKGIPAGEIIWDGRSSTGELVLAAEDYPYVFTATDSLGNTWEERGLIPIDILVIRDGERLKIKISSITFAPNSPEVILDTSEKGAKNLSVLKRLVEVLVKYGNYQIRIEGHANNISGTQKEDDEELKPLSLARALHVKKALVDMGLGARRIDVEGKGGREMLFPSKDPDNSWKNRRVEFILVK